MHPPIPNSYLIPDTRLAAGEYPGSSPSAPSATAHHKLTAFLDAGITAFIDLTSPDDPLEPYAPAHLALAGERNIDVTYEQLTIRDMDVCEPTHMLRILDTIAARLAEGRGVYVHCWGGIGRTGTVVGCWLVRHGRSGEEALRDVNALFRTMSPTKVRDHESWGSPQTEPQREVVRSWAQHDTARLANPTATSSMRAPNVSPPPGDPLT